MTYFHEAQAVATVQFQSWPRAISSEPVQFQVMNLCKLKVKLHVPCIWVLYSTR